MAADPDKDLRDRFEALKAPIGNGKAGPVAALPSDEELLSRLKSLVGKDLVAPPPVSSSSSATITTTTTTSANAPTARSYALAPNIHPTLDADEIASLLLTTNLLSEVDVDFGYEDDRMDVPSIPVPGDPHPGGGGVDGVAVGSAFAVAAGTRPPVAARGHSFDGKFVDYTNLVLTSPTRGRVGLDFGGGEAHHDDDDDDEVRDIMEQVGAQVALENKYGGGGTGAGDEDDFERRLRGLKEFVPTPTPGSKGASSSGGDGGDRQSSEESSPTAAGQRQGGGKSSHPTTDIHPAPSTLGPPPRVPSLEDFANADDEGDERWCCVCSDDATVRCEICDNDMYCRSCFRQEHALDDEIRHHVPKLLTASKN
ncbi:Abscission/NoCut checkpoint regulator [Geranomyces michiganensis]|nr:Abscission/NoCut checkpoint regulator [Geranomyces michiganensis]